MMHLTKCYNCPHKKDCKKKVRILSALRVAAKEIGGRIWSINFDCWERLDNLEPGRVVRLELMKFRQGDAVEGESYWEYFEGVVMRPQKNRVLVWLLHSYSDISDVEKTGTDGWDSVCDDQHNPVSLHPDRMKPTDKTVNICDGCGQPEGTTTRDGRRCYCVNITYEDHPQTTPAGKVPIEEMPF